MPRSCLLILGLIALATVPPARGGEEQHPRRILGEDGGRVAIVDEQGHVHWKYETGAQSHDLWKLPNGNILLASGPATIAEVTPEKEIAWTYTSRPKPGYEGPVEVHAFQPLGEGKVMIAESGNRRIIEVNRGGEILREVPLVVEHPHHHTDTRLARKLTSGNYLVCHESDGAVREYQPDGTVVWEYQLDLGGRPAAAGHGPEGHGTSVYSAYRLENGNTLIGGGNNNRVLEVNPDGEIVWSVDQRELPGITLAWVTMLHPLPNGNLIIGNCHAGPENPQLIEVTRDKQVVWTFQDFKTFGNGLAATRILEGRPASNE